MRRNNIRNKKVVNTCLLVLQDTPSDFVHFLHINRIIGTATIDRKIFGILFLLQAKERILYRKYLCLYRKTACYILYLQGIKMNDNTTLAPNNEAANTTAVPVAGGDGDTVGVENLYPALIECFGIIALGYLAGR